MPPAAVSRLHPSDEPLPWNFSASSDVEPRDAPFLNERETLMRKSVFAVLFVLVFAFAAYSQSENPLLLQHPTVSRTQIAFAYGGDLWIVSREGGDAIRLTTGASIESEPYFSPDGTMIAFSGEYAGNDDVYIIPAAGGVPKRLTYHPGPDVVRGWTPDGKKILFASNRNSENPSIGHLFTILIDGVFPTQMPLPQAVEGSFSPDGSHLAYRPNPDPFGEWKRYRGGLAQQIWIADLSDSSIVKLPRTDSNDFDPMWVSKTIYFLSDRNGPPTLFSYDTNSKKVTELVSNHSFAIKSATAGPGAIVYEQFGSLHLYDLASGKEHAVQIRVAGDMPEVRPRFESVAGHILSAAISPTGARAVFEAHGEILTVPGEKGDARNITHSPTVADRDPAWSPDGKWIAYFSDESGEYALHLRDQSGMGDVKKIDLGKPPSFFYEPHWSPDSKKIAYTDKRLNVWYVDLEKGTPVKIDSDTYEVPQRALDPSWSPDSGWITYTKILPSHMRAVFVYSLETGKSTQVTDGMSDAKFAVFDRDGKALYFTASTNIGPTTGWLDMSSYDHTVTRSVYAMMLRKDLPSLLAPESDEEKVAPEAKPEAKKEGTGATAAGEKEKEKGKEKQPPAVTIDFDNIGQRIISLPIPALDYAGMEAGKSGQLFLLEAPPGPGQPGPPQLILHKFDLSKRKTEVFVAGIQGFDVSFDGEKILFRQGPRWAIVPTAQPAKPAEGSLRTGEMEVFVDPRAEWKQMYHETWRIERDFLYDPNAHGLNLGEAEKKYSVFLDGVASREDLNYLFKEMLGQINVGHMFVAGGDEPEVKPIHVGLLGADYAIENGRYRFVRVFNGENWNPQLRAPLTQPGVNVASGEYLLTVNGRELHSSDNIYSFFQETADRQIVIKAGPNADGTGSREVTVVPVQNEAGLRNRAWIEDNLRKVEALSGGKLAYIYLPNTGGAGFTNFNRYYFAQVGKEGAVIDERYNGGGSAADYMIEYMQRKLWNWWMTREGADFATPTDSIFGPKAMIINGYAGSGGDALPWYFHHVGIGPLVGTRTWGGLVGIYGYPQLIDGGFVTAPRVAFFTTDGRWDVENHGTDPDIQIELDPKAWREGHDVQLDKAVQVVMEALKKNPPQTPQRPAFPNYSKDH
jgi:tricorn protease